MVAMLFGIEAMGHLKLVQGLPRALHGANAVQCSTSYRGSASLIPGSQSCHCMVEGLRLSVLFRPVPAEFVGFQLALAK